MKRRGWLYGFAARTFTAVLISNQTISPQLKPLEGCLYHAEKVMADDTARTQKEPFIYYARAGYVDEFR